MKFLPEDGMTVDTWWPLERSHCDSNCYKKGSSPSCFLPRGKQTAGPLMVVPGIFRPFLSTHQQYNSWHCWSSYCPSGLHFGLNSPSRGGSKANLSRADCLSSWHFVRFTNEKNKIIIGTSISEKSDIEVSDIDVLWERYSERSQERCDGLIVSALASTSRSQGLSPGQGHCVLFLGNTL